MRVRGLPLQCKRSVSLFSTKFGRQTLRPEYPTPCLLYLRSGRQAHSKTRAAQNNTVKK